MKTAAVLECDFASGQNKNRENEFGGAVKRAQIQAAFEQGAIQFVDDDEMGGFGLRMANKKRKR